MPNVTAMQLVQDAAAYGLVWTFNNTLQNKDDVVLSDKVPLLQYADSVKAMAELGREHFDAELVSSQSSRVRQQNRIRPLLESGKVKRSDVAEMQRLAAEALLKVRSGRAVVTREVEVFLGPDGRKFATREDSIAYSRALYVNGWTGDDEDADAAIVQQVLDELGIEDVEVLDEVTEA